MDTLAEPILERDKERGGGVVVTTATTSDAVAVSAISTLADPPMLCGGENRPALEGKPHIWPPAALLLLDIVKTMARRRALHASQIWGFQCIHYLVKPQ